MGIDPENQGKGEIGAKEEENQADKIGQDLSYGPGEFIPITVLG